MKIEIFVSNDDIKENFGIDRDYKLDDEQFQEKCDCLDMSPYDKDIAVLEEDGCTLELVTTADRWNVYLVISENEVTNECVNATLDAKEWESITDIIDYLIAAIGLGGESGER